jgi:uncharacterized iron-regulated membrane protein
VAGEEPPARRGAGPGGPPGKASPKRERGAAKEERSATAQRDPGRKREKSERRAEGLSGLRAEAPASPTDAAAAADPAGESRGETASAASQRSEPSRGQQPDGASRERRGNPGGVHSAEPDLRGVDALLARAEEQVDGWRTITLRLPLPSDKPVSFAIDQGSGGQPHLRSTLTLDRNTGAVVAWETFRDGTPGRQLRSWLRFIHTGEAGGIAGQTVAGIVSGGAVFLVYTGLALTLRRFAAWVRRKRSRVKERVLVET